MDERIRPNPVRWVMYAFGTGLPERHRTWVLHDVTAPTWQLRHFARTTVQLLPIGVLLFVFIPGPAWVRAMAVLAGALLGYFYSVAYMQESAEHRVMKAGYAVGHANAVREEAHADEHAALQRRYEQRYRQ